MSIKRKKNGTFEKGSKPVNGFKRGNKEYMKRSKTTDYLKKLSEATKRYLSKNDNPFKGKKHSRKTREHLSKTTSEYWAKEKNRASQTGQNNHNWRGGISFEPYPTEFNRELKKSIRRRDGDKCLLCGCDWRRLDTHHIDYDKQNCSPHNLITLCSSCHAKTNHNREKWTKYFEEGLLCVA